MQEFVCCLCGMVCSGYGNNPWPLSVNEDDRCCDDCNSTKVIPARIAGLVVKTDTPTEPIDE